MLPSDPLPLFSEKNIPQHQLASYTIHLLPACQLLPACRLLTTCESFNKPPAPGTHTTRAHNTQAGKDSQYNDCYYNNN